MRARNANTRCRGRGTPLLAAVGWVLLSVALTGASSSRKAGDTKAAPGSEAGGGAVRDEAAQVRPFELQVLELINQERKRRGVPPLKLSSKLSRVARTHSEEMRDKGYMGHISPVSRHSTPRKRFRRVFGYEPYLIGENVARRAGPQWCLTAERIGKTHQGLMGSRHHRDNILRPEFRHVGIGIAVNEGGHYWVTEVFVRASAPAEEKDASRLARKL
jgi:uncharacterized protein YkwD